MQRSTCESLCRRSSRSPTMLSILLVIGASLSKPHVVRLTAEISVVCLSVCLSVCLNGVIGWTMFCQRRSYQPSRFLLEYPAKTPLIPLSRFSTSNSHILDCALRPTCATQRRMPLQLAIQYTPPRDSTHAHCNPPRSL